jgi:TatD DNase family protein
MQQPLLPITGSTSTTSENTASIESSEGTNRDSSNATPSSTGGAQHHPPLSLQILKDDAVEESNIVAMISPSSTMEDAQRGLHFLQTTYSEALKEGTKLPLIRTTVGVHPYHVNDLHLEDSIYATMNVQDKVQRMMQQARTLVQQYNSSPRNNDKWIVAIGECGLDASPGFPPLDDQLPWFEAQVELAQEMQLPLYVHERLALQPTLRILDGMKHPVPVLIHCFTGGIQECQEYIQRGYYLSFSGFVLKSGEACDATRQCLRDAIPSLSRIMIETDAPYMGFPNSRQRFLQKQTVSLNGLTSKQRKRLQNSLYPNVPSSLVAVLDQVVTLLNENKSQQLNPLTRDILASHCTSNAMKFFGLSI